MVITIFIVTMCNVVNIYVLCNLLPFVLLQCAIQPLAVKHELNKTVIELH